MNLNVSTVSNRYDFWGGSDLTFKMLQVSDALLLQVETPGMVKLNQLEGKNGIFCNAPLEGEESCLLYAHVVSFYHSPKIKLKISLQKPH